jgi:D-aminopeptidase
MIRRCLLIAACGTAAIMILAMTGVAAQQRPRDLGIVNGTLPTGPLDAITDVAGVRVGQTTIIEGDSVRTGVTAILPHGGNLFQDRVPAAIHVGNGFGKLLGVTQVQELGELETPILLTCTLCVWRVADALVAELLARPGMERVRSINPVVGETNDGYVLNAIRSRPVGPPQVRRPWPARLPARWPKAASAPGPAPSPSDGRAGSTPRPASPWPPTAAGPWACWSSPTSAVT